jgi:hypothetical protein
MLRTRENEVCGGNPEQGSYATNHGSCALWMSNETSIKMNVLLESLDGPLMARSLSRYKKAAETYLSEKAQRFD